MWEVISRVISLIIAIRYISISTIRVLIPSRHYQHGYKRGLSAGLYGVGLPCTVGNAPRTFKNAPETGDNQKHDLGYHLTKIGALLTILALYGGKRESESGHKKSPLLQ